MTDPKPAQAQSAEQGKSWFRSLMEKANLRGATLHETNLQGADLRGADLSISRGLNKEQLEQAFRDEDTLLPESLQ
jgi:uncharacterized protein YjbI with pentapeptide repeats